MNSWIENNLSELKRICHRVSRSEDIDDLLQLCIEQLLKNKRFPDVPDSQKLFFFTKLVRNNHSSTSSPYYRQYKKFKTIEFGDIDIKDVEYNPIEINLEWVKLKIEEDKRDGDWYFARLFEIYVEEGCSIKKTSLRTTIPMNSVSRDINRYRRHLRKYRDQFLN